jgi:hypothetical protein
MTQAQDQVIEAFKRLSAEEQLVALEAMASAAQTKVRATLTMLVDGKPYHALVVATQASEGADTALREVAARLIARMNANPLPLNTPAFTREDLHERR